MRPTICVTVSATCLLIAVCGALAQQLPPSAPPLPPGQMPQQAGMPPQPMPAMQPPELAPSFLEVGKEYLFVLVRKELRGEVLEIDRSGWIRVLFRTKDRDIPPVPWLNLYHVTMIVPLEGVQPVED